MRVCHVHFRSLASSDVKNVCNASREKEGLFFDACDRTVVAPGGLNTAFLGGGEEDGTVVDGQGECELAFGS